MSYKYKENFSNDCIKASKDVFKAYVKKTRSKKGN